MPLQVVDLEARAQVGEARNIDEQQSAVELPGVWLQVLDAVSARILRELPVRDSRRKSRQLQQAAIVARAAALLRDGAQVFRDARPEHFAGAQLPILATHEAEHLVQYFSLVLSRSRFDVACRVVVGRGAAGVEPRTIRPTLALLAALVVRREPKVLRPGQVRLAKQRLLPPLEGGSSARLHVREHDGRTRIPSPIGRVTVHALSPHRAQCPAVESRGQCKGGIRLRRRRAVDEGHRRLQCCFFRRRVLARSRFL
mmetsp:Transcript_64646/g.179559  ORF Transcript_64646/g.179559 Transcript_64646/m.179559 type:complete len:255 (+) Transcript_64646:4953-5717(+)